METLKSTLDLIQENEETVVVELACGDEPLHCSDYYSADDLAVVVVALSGRVEARNP